MSISACERTEVRQRRKKRERWTVDCIGGSAGSGEGRAGFGQVPKFVLHLALGELNLDQQGLVIKPLHFPQQGGEQAQCLGVGRSLQIQRSQTGFNALAEEGALLAFGPLDGLLAEFDLKAYRVGDVRHEIDQRAHCRTERVSVTVQKEERKLKRKRCLPILAVLALAMTSKKGRI